MAVTKAQQRAVAKYMKAKYDEIKLLVPAGQKEIIKARAEAQGQSVNAYIKALIEKDMEEPKP